MGGAHLLYLLGTMYPKYCFKEADAFGLLYACCLLFNHRRDPTMSLSHESGLVPTAGREATSVTRPVNGAAGTQPPQRLDTFLHSMRNVQMFEVQKLKKNKKNSLESRRGTLEAVGPRDTVFP